MPRKYGAALLEAEPQRIVVAALGSSLSGTAKTVVPLLAVSQQMRPFSRPKLNYRSWSDHVG